MSKLSVPLKKFLGFNSFACALTAFLACRNLVRPAYSLGFLVALAFSVFIDTFKWKHPSRVFINVISLAAFGTAVATARIDSVVETFMGAVLLMLAVKLLEDKGARDHVQIIILAVIAIVSAAVLSLRAEFVFYYVAMSYFLGLGLLLCTLFARSAGLKFTRDGIRQLLTRALVIWLMMLPVCLVLFFTAPRARVALARAQYQGLGSATAGFSDRITHGTIGRIQESNEIALRAEMPQIAGSDLYWRGLVLNAFEGNEWLARQYRSPAERTFGVTGERVQQHIFLEQGQFRVLFALDKPVVVNGEGAAHIGEGIYMRLGSRPAKQLSYNVVSALTPVMKPFNPDFRKDFYLRLPENFSPRIRDLARQLTDGLDEKGKIRAIQSYLAPPAFTYTLENLPTSPNALEDFLFTYKRGNCEYFASSMAVLCRMAGIPSRLIAGYRGGYYNDGGGYYIVMQRNAHAWVELWDSEEQVWRRYDPTPANDSIEEGLEKRAPGTFGMYLDILNYRVSQLVVEYSGEMQLEALERLQAFLMNPGESFAPAVERLKSALRSALCPIVAIVLAASGSALCFLLYRTSRQSPEKALLKKFLSAMKRRGYVKHPSEGLEEFVRSIPAAGGGELRALAWRFVQAFEDDYFRDRPIRGETIAELRDILGQIKRSNLR